MEHLLKDQRVEVNENDNFGYSALIIAALAGHASVVHVQLLLNDRRVNVNSADNLGFNALMHAATRGHQTVVQLLLCDERVDANLKAVAAFKSLTADEEAVLSPEDVGEAHVDGTVVTKKESWFWNCNTPDKALELMKCKGCKRVRFF